MFLLSMLSIVCNIYSRLMNGLIRFCKNEGVETASLHPSLCYLIRLVGALCTMASAVHLAGKCA